MMWVVFALISTAPGILMLALVCAFLRGISHDVFADDPMDEYADLHTGPTYSHRSISWGNGESGEVVTFNPPTGFGDMKPMPPDAGLHIAPDGTALLRGAPFPPWVSRPPL